MIKTAAEMLSALSGSNPRFRGVVLYAGMSAIDGKPIVAIANRITADSTNEKTGAMVQTFIMRADIAPHDALKTGDDSSVCGDCMHRPANGGTCYVRVFQAPLSAWKAYHRGRYAVPGLDYDVAILPELFAGLAFRLGTYGDPAAVPYQVWRATTLKARAITGYTHQWRNPKFAAFKTICMASADSADDYRAATSQGWRTFRVRAESEPLLEREVVCPASKEAGAKTNCAACKACGGLGAKAKINMAIVAHGATAKRFVNSRAA